MKPQLGLQHSPQFCQMVSPEQLNSHFQPSLPGAQKCLSSVLIQPVFFQAPGKIRTNRKESELLYSQGADKMMRECLCLELRPVRSGRTSELSDQAAPSFPGGVPLVKEGHTSHPGQRVPPGGRRGQGHTKLSPYSLCRLRKALRVKEKYHLYKNSTTMYYGLGGKIMFVMKINYRTFTDL